MKLLDFVVVYASSDAKLDQSLSEAELSEMSESSSDNEKRVKVYNTLLQPDYWISSRYCNYPQELIIKFYERTVVQEVELRVHAQLVPTRIDVFMGNPENAELEPYWKAKYDKVGTMRFNDSRDVDVKRIQCDHEGYYLKLLVYRNHTDRKRNEYDQIGIISFGALGYEGSKNRRPARDANERPGSVDRRSRSKDRRGSDGDHALLRKLLSDTEREKEKAEDEGNRRKEKACANLISDIKEAIPEIDELEKQKHKAVERDDFDKAKECKRNVQEIIDELKLQYDTITGKVKAKRPSSSDSNRDMKGDRTYSYRAGDLRIDTEKIQLPNLDSDDESRPQHMNRRKPPSRDSNSSNSNTSKHRQHKEFEPINANNEPRQSPMYDQEPAYQVDADRLAPAARVFGDNVIARLYSKKWQDRKAAIDEIKRRMTDAQGKECQDMLEAVAIILPKVLRDKVYQVYASALDLHDYVVNPYTQKCRCAKDTARLLPSKCCPILVNRTGDTVNESRFKKSTLESVAQIPQCDPQVARAYCTEFLAPFEASGYVKIDQGHAEIARILVDDGGAPNPELNMSEEEVCDFAMSCLLHTDPEVRHSGMQLIKHMYQNGNQEEVLSHLPPRDSVKAKKDPLFKMLFAELDGNGRGGSSGSRGDSRNSRGSGGGASRQSRTGSRQQRPPSKERPPSNDNYGYRSPPMQDHNELERLRRENEELKEQLYHQDYATVAQTTGAMPPRRRKSYGDARPSSSELHKKRTNSSRIASNRPKSQAGRARPYR